MFLVGNVICRNSMYHDGRTLKDLYKSKDVLIDIDIMKFIKERNQLLVKFFLGFSGIQLYNETNKIRFTFATAIEMCYYLRDLTLVLPFSFLGNLVQSCISGSKTVTMFNGKIAPTGGYTTFKQWIEDKGANPLKCMDGTLDIFFDNIGKYIIKNYGISSSKKTADVITTCLQIRLEDPLNLQFIPIIRSKDVTKVVHSKMESEISLADDNFRTYRFFFLANIYEIAKAENDTYVEKRVSELGSEFTKICGKCNITYTSLKRVCGNCKESLEQLRSCIDDNCFENINLHTLSENIGHKSDTENRPTAKMAEPVLLNPNSFKNLESILNELKEFAGIPSLRHWLFVGCDGPPYVIVSKLVEMDPEKYGWLLLVPGLGHLHMNQQKTIFKILDEIVLEALGKEVLNFQSPKAYKFFVDAKDTHKTWEGLQVLLIGSSLELMRQYLAENKNNSQTSVIGFLNWQQGHLDANISLFSQLILTYVLAAYFYKIGVRHNDVELINASRMKFMDLFFAFNHPIYREVEYRDLKNRVSYPPDIRSLRDRNMSYSTSTLIGKSKGGDFMLEEKVKRQKLLAPKGPITSSTWRTISRSLDEFDEIYSAVSAFLHLKDPDFA